MLFFVLAAFIACISPCLNISENENASFADYVGLDQSKNYSPISKSVYFLVMIDAHNNYTQQEAREKCNSLGAELASVHSNDDFLNIMGLTWAQKYRYDCFWIGLVLYWHVSVPTAMPMAMATAVPNTHIINISWVDGTPMDWGNPIEIGSIHPNSSSSSSSSNDDIWPWGYGSPSNYWNNTRNCVYFWKGDCQQRGSGWISSPCDSVTCFSDDPINIVCEMKQQ